MFQQKNNCCQKLFICLTWNKINKEINTKSLWGILIKYWSEEREKYWICSGFEFITVLLRASFLDFCLNFVFIVFVDCTCTCTCICICICIWEYPHTYLQSSCLTISPSFWRSTKLDILPRILTDASSLILSCSKLNHDQDQGHASSVPDYLRDVVARLLAHLGHLLLKQGAKLSIGADVCLRVL